MTASPRSRPADPAQHSVSAVRSNTSPGTPVGLEHIGKEGWRGGGGEQIGALLAGLPEGGPPSGENAGQQQRAGGRLPELAANRPSRPAGASAAAELLDRRDHQRRIRAPRRSGKRTTKPSSVHMHSTSGRARPGSWRSPPWPRGVHPPAQRGQPQTRQSPSSSRQRSPRHAGRRARPRWPRPDRADRRAGSAARSSRPCR